MNSSLRINVWIVPYLRDDSCFKVAAWWAWWLTVCAPPAERPPLPELCLFFDWLVQYNCIIVLQLQANCDNTVVMGQIGFFDSILYRLLFLEYTDTDINRYTKDIVSWVCCYIRSEYRCNYIPQSRYSHQPPSIIFLGKTATLWTLTENCVVKTTH